VQKGKFFGGSVDPRLDRQRRGRRRPKEAIGPSGEGGVENHLASGADLLSPAEMDIGRRVQGDAGVAVAVVVVGEEPGAEHPGRLDAREPARETAPVLEVLNCASEKGLSLDWCGRLWLWSTPRSASSWVTVFEVIEVPGRRGS
jgi:hypothetical protein